MELSDGAGTLGCIATHEHAKMVAKQLQTMFHSDRCVSLLGLISRGWNKFSDCGGESASTAIIIGRGHKNLGVPQSTLFEWLALPSFT